MSSHLVIPAPLQGYGGGEPNPEAGHALMRLGDSPARFRDASGLTVVDPNQRWAAFCDMDSTRPNASFMVARVGIKALLEGDGTDIDWTGAVELEVEIPNRRANTPQELGHTIVAFTKAGVYDVPILGYRTPRVPRPGQAA